MDLMLGALIEFVLQVVFVTTGGVVVRALSFGRWRGEKDGESLAHSAGGALWFRRGEQVVLTDLSLGFVGFPFVLAAVVASSWLAFSALSP